MKNHPLLFKKKINKRFSPLKAFFKWLGLAFIWGALGLFAVVLWFGYDLPNLEELAKLPRQPSITIWDRNGVVIGTYGDFYGQPIIASRLKKHVVNALLATEDRRFFYHFGIDPIGLLRAFSRNVSAGTVVQGGSTITQQLARNFFESKKLYSYKDRSLKHKIKEALLSLLIESRFTKDQILTMYLNRVYMGAGAIGLDAAAMRYFGHSAYDLTLYEAAIIVGLLKGPSRYSPASNYERSEERAQRVLKAMVEEKFITPQEASAAMALPSPLEMESGPKNTMARYFSDWIIDRLPLVLEVPNEDLDIITTLESPVQKIAQKQMNAVMQNYGKACQASQSSLVAMKPDGAIVAMLGGIDYRQSCFNRATQAHRQAGSSFKFFVFLAALEDGYSPDSMIDDRTFYIGNWKAGNYKYHSSGSISMRNALAQSVNSVAVRLACSVGIRKVMKMAKDLGISSPLPRNYTLALGSGGVTLLEMTGSWGCLLNEGCKVTPYGVLMIKNKQGKVLYQHKTATSDPVLSQESVDQMRSMMTSVVDYGSGRKARLSDGRKAAGKTGTSQKYRDFWFIGMTSDLVTGVWCGNDNEKPMVKTTQGWPSLHLWKQFNEAVYKYYKDPSNPIWEEGGLDPSATPAKEASGAPKPQQEVDSSEEANEEEDDEEEEEEEEKSEENNEATDSQKKTPAKNSVQQEPRPPKTEDQMIDDLVVDLEKTLPPSFQSSAQ